MAFNAPPKFLVIDDFLPAHLVADLLEFTLENQSAFAPTQVMLGGDALVDVATRQSGHLKDGLGPHKAEFKASIHAHLDQIVEALGIQHFDVARTETQLIAHGNNAFYKPHIDTLTGAFHERETNLRIVSLVYYFYREPKRFTGGEIALFPFGSQGEATAIEPKLNRLVAFPSFTWHEVRKVFCPSGDFADSRFAINCWLRKDKGLPPNSSAPA